MATFGLLTKEWLTQEIRTDDSTVLFTSTRRNLAINDGYAEFCDLTECLIRVSTVTCCSKAPARSTSCTDSYSLRASASTAGLPCALAGR